MEKKYLLTGCLFAIMLGTQANAQSTTTLSDVPAFDCAYDALDATTKVNRTGPTGKLISYLELNGQQCKVDEAGSRNNVFVDKTTTVLKVKRGSTYALKMMQKVGFAWMHTCLWIDYNQNGAFSKEEGYTVDSNSELASFDLFSLNAESDAVKGINSRGKVASRQGLSGLSGGIYTLPEFTIPSDATTGTTRMRFICNWGSIDPSGLISGNSLGPSNNTAASTGATIVDVTLQIEDDTYPVTFTAPNSEYGTLKVMNGDQEITSGANISAGTELTIEATPSSNEYALKAILVNGETIEGNTVTVNNNIEITAEFIKGRWFTYTATEGGMFTVKKGATDVANETAVELGSALQLTFAPNNGYELTSFMMNGQDMTADIVNGTYSISSVTENINLQVVFSKQNFKFSYSFNSLGNVTVKAGGDNVETEQLIPYETVLSISVIPETQCFVKSLLLNGVEKKEELLPDGNGTFTLTITEETSLKVEFEATLYTLSCSTPLYGTMKIVNSEDPEHVYANEDQLPVSTILNIYLNAAADNELLELMIDEGDGPIDYLAEGGVEVLEDGTYYTYIQIFDHVSVHAKFSVPTGIASTNLKDASISLTSENTIAVEGVEAGSLVSIYTITGQEIAKTIVQKQTETITVPTQVFYLVKISNNTGSVVKKLTK